MNIEIKVLDNEKIAEIHSAEVIINTLDDALDLIGNSNYYGSNKIILKEENMTAEFFDLKTGIAGEILQKFSTYGMKLAIIGDFSKYPGRSFRDFIYESNKIGRICFVGSREEAVKSLKA